MSSPQVKFVLDAAWRRRWLLVLPPILGLVVGWAVVRRMPEMYTAKTVIVVQGQRVPEKLMEATVTAGLDELLANIKVTVLSPDYLEQVAKDIRLVKEDAGPVEMEAARKELERKISVVQNLRQANFSIEVTDGSARRAARAANKLAELFLSENKVVRTAMAEETLEFFKEERALAEQELDKAESALAEFQRRNYDDLPARQQEYQTRIGLLQEWIRGATDEIATKEGQIAILESQGRTDVTLSAISGAVPPGAEGTKRKLDQAHADLTDLLTRYSEQHPDVRFKRDQIRTLEEEYTRVLAGSGDPANPDAPADNSTEGQIARLRRDIEELKRRRDGHGREIDTLWARIRNAPMVAQELGELQRVLEDKRLTYSQLVDKERQSAQGQKLEEAGRGVLLRVQTRAFPPPTPSSPVLLYWLLGGAGLGLILGVGIAFGLEKLDPSLRNEEVFRHCFPDIPLLVAIPRLGPDSSRANPRGAGGRRGAKRRRSRKAAAAVGLALTAAPGLVEMFLGGVRW